MDQFLPVIGTDPLDGCDEADELLMPMARHAAADTTLPSSTPLSAANRVVVPWRL